MPGDTGTPCAEDSIMDNIDEVYDRWHEECDAPASAPFTKDTLYYHEPLVDDDEEHCVVHETDKAILSEVGAGQFWVPKSLMRERGGEVLVHRVFTREYIETSDKEALCLKP